MGLDQRILEEVVVAGLLMPRRAFCPVGPIIDLTVGGNTLFFCASAERRIRANASGAAADYRQVLTPNGGNQDGHAR
jgi:hypothetical protein